ncbi:MAG: C25 family cysteine peptidase [Anaerolineae bacterium]
MSQRQLFLIAAFCLAFGFTWGVVAEMESAYAAASTDITQVVTETNVRPLRSDEHGIEFDLFTPAFASNKEGNVEVAGLERTLEQPGAPPLPYYATFIALPPEATVHVSVAAGSVQEQAVSRLRPAPQPTLAGAKPLELSVTSPDPGLEFASSTIYERDPAVYQNNAFFPYQALELSAPMYYRDMRLVELRLYPLRYNPISGVLSQAERLHVTVSFDGGDLTDLRPLPSPGNSYQRALADSTLNYEKALAWRSLPNSLREAAGPGLPLGIDTYKIELDRDGIYEINGADLAAAGMAISSVDPGAIEIMNQGSPVAFQFIGNSNNVLESNEIIRFYGTAYHASKREEQFITRNVYWLWAGGTPTTILTKTNQANQGFPITTTFTSTVTEAPEQYYFSTWTDEWGSFPNEPDAWYWDLVVQPPNTPAVTRTYPITLPYPAAVGPDASYTIELMSRESKTNPTNLNYTVRGYLNNHPAYGETIWQYVRNVNITNTVPLTVLQQNGNDMTLVFATDTSATSAQIYLNRISVTYLRQLKALGDHLIFEDANGGSREFHVSGFNEGAAGNVLVWDITDPLNPVQIELSNGDIVGAGPYTYTIGSMHNAGATFIATTAANVLPATAISQYTPVSLDPASGAEWVAISHRDLITAASQLAAHRADPAFGGLKTHVVDIEDVINQFGYGLPLPQAITDFLAYAVVNWSVAPSYVTLFGDATINPRQLGCLSACPSWNPNVPTLLVTDLQFVDRFQGMVPTDHTFTLLSGNDLLPDMAIGRIAAETLPEATALVNKIIKYETNQFTPANWQQNILFVADNTDHGGDFCQENVVTGNKLPSSFTQTHLCLPGSETNPPSITDTLTLRDEMDLIVNGPNAGVSILNYRGHGSIQFWASPNILNEGLTDFWMNVNKPAVILSADCLDGHFAWPGLPALSETFLMLDNVGTAAHWSSTGLGYTGEHTVLHAGFYEGLFDMGMTAIGDAANYAKLKYHLGNYHNSEMYAFTLQGDPAMQMYRPEISLQKNATWTDTSPGRPVEFALEISNNGVYPAHVTVTDTLPAGLSYGGASATAPLNASVVGNEVIFELTTGLGWGETATITLRTVVDIGAVGTLTNQAVAAGTGLEINPGNQSDSAAVTSHQYLVFLPTIINQ